MTHVIADLVLERTTTEGAGSYELGGADEESRSFQSVMATNDTCWYVVRQPGTAAFGGADEESRSFQSVMATNDTCWYVVRQPGTAAFEVGLGTLTAATTLVRTAILASSNAGAAVDWGAGVKLIHIDMPAKMLAALVAPASFRAHKNGTDQTGVASATLSKVTFGTELWDAGGYYDAANSRWTPPPGKIMIVGRIGFAAVNIVDQATMYWTVHRNGDLDTYVTSIQCSGTSNGPGLAGIFIGETNGSDYFEVHAFGGGAGDKTIVGLAGGTYIAGSMLSVI